MYPTAILLALQNRRSVPGKAAQPFRNPVSTPAKACGTDISRTTDTAVIRRCDDIDRIESERRNGMPARTAAGQVANDTTIFCKRTRFQYRVLLSSPARRTGKTEARTKHSNR